jgi:hypothetical protein
VLQTCDGPPVLSVPSVYMTTVGTRPVAVPNLALTSRLSIERSETTLAQTRLTFHEPQTTPPGKWGRLPLGDVQAGATTVQGSAALTTSAA